MYKKYLLKIFMIILAYKRVALYIYISTITNYYTMSHTDKRELKDYEINIIHDYVSTALISEDPEEYLQRAMVTLIEISSVKIDKSALLEYLYHSEKTIVLRGR